MRVLSKEYFLLLPLILMLMTPINISVGKTSTRNYIDQEDDLKGFQFHIFYVIPSDGNDRGLDTDGTLNTSVTAAISWFKAQTGYDLRYDTFNGKLDITFYKSTQSNDAIKAFGAGMATEIERELNNASLLSLDKKYVIYYDGEGDWACGGSSWGPNGSQSAAFYLKTNSYYADCSAVTFTNNVSVMKYWEYVMLHESMHTIGLVSTCAPNSDGSNNVDDDPRDLMYTGPQIWRPSMVDVNNDDYFNHTSNCPELSEYLWGNFTTSTITTKSTPLVSSPPEIPTTSKNYNITIGYLNGMNIISSLSFLMILVIFLKKIETS